MKDSLIFGFVVSTAAVTAILILINMFDKGEPRIFNAAVTGIAIGVTNIAVYSWMKKKNSKSQNNQQT